MIDVHIYLEIADQFRFRWDPTILGVLAERPFRFRELLSRIEKHADGHVDDNALMRGLDRLKRAQHIQATKTMVGRREVSLYTITAEGRRRLRMYGDFIDIYRRLHSTRPQGAASPAPTPIYEH